MHDPVGQRREDQVGLLGGHAGRDGLLGVERAEPDLHQRCRDLHDVRRGALHHRDVGAVLPQRAADVEGASCCDPITTAFLPAYASGPGCAEEWCWSPRNMSMPGDRRACSACRTSRWRAPAASGAARRGWPSRSTSTVHSPVSSSYDARLGLGARPVVELHHLGVGLEPVGDLVLGREHRPVLGELDVGQVVVPDRVVQAQRLVAAAPLVAGPRVLVDHERRHAELAQPGAERDAALAAADDQHVGLGRRSRGSRPRARAARPRSRGPGWRRARRPAAGGRALRLLVALELVERGEQRPGLVLAVLRDQAQQAACRGRPRSRTRSRRW